MSTKKSEPYQRLTPVNQRPPFEFIVIIEENEAEQFIQETLINNIGLGSRIERRNNAVQVMDELTSAQRLTDIPDLILLSLPADSEAGSRFLDKFSELPDLVRARCKLIVITSGNSKEAKQRAIMNPGVIRYLEKPVDFYHFKDFMFS